MRDWVVYAAIATVVFLLFFRDNAVGAIAGVLISGPLYLAFGAVMAKFGYTRKSFSELREEGRATAEAKADAKGSRRSDGRDAADATRPRPAPTKRTGGGNRQRPSSKRKR
jgi:hypothetical protein